MAGWDFERINKPTINLMQNCDLPPPLKLFSSPDETFHSSISKIYENVGGHEAKKECDEQSHTCENFSGNNDKMEILKALRLSQIRAREAERKLRTLSKEKEMLSNMFVDESLRLFAYRQWVNLLEFEVFKLQKRQQQQQEETRQRHYDVTNRADNEGISRKKLCAAGIALCLAIAGMGVAFGCRCLF